MRDEDWMRHALRVAAQGLGKTWPNPAVGCVLVRDGRLIAEAATQPGGRPHAEAAAIALAGEAARGASAYVTLEPCAHTGKTPPCCDALIKAGITRTIVAIEDPDPRTAGQGFARLRAAGVALTTGICAPEAEEITKGFLTRIRHGRPALTLKLATTIDARIATAKGESRWITSPMARLYAHHLRATHDAILVGTGTAIADDPSLDIRGLGPQPQLPVRLVLDTRLAVPLTHKIARTARSQPTWLLTGPAPDAARAEAWRELGAEILPCPLTPDNRLDLPAALRLLAEKGLTRILAEGGGALGAGLLGAGLVDDLVTLTAGKIIGADGTPAIAPMGLTNLENAPAFHRVETRPLGPDILTRWQPHR